jgi:ATP-dependent RNA helicase DDX19/DBP5
MPYPACSLTHLVSNTCPDRTRRSKLLSFLGNIIAQSQSGTGKTAAFTIAMLSRIDPAVHGAQALVLVPTFELALQIGSVIEKMAYFLPYIQIAYAVRDSSKSKRASRSRGKPLPEPIVVGTPGTVDEWCRKLRMIDLQQLRVFVVDEADVMIATQGFRANCEDLVKRINKSHCQMLLFSATYSDEVMEFAHIIVNNPVVVRLKREKQTLSNIQQFYIKCPDAEHKYNAIENVYAYLDIGQTVIFCQMKRAANDLAVRMANKQHSVRVLTGDLDIEQRANTIQQFRDGHFRVLISTNLVARGKLGELGLSSVDSSSSILRSHLAHRRVFTVSEKQEDVSCGLSRCMKIRFPSDLVTVVWKNIQHEN